MKYLILLMVLSAGLMAQNTIFGKAGMPDEWDIITMDVDTLRVSEIIDADSAYILADSIDTDHLVVNVNIDADATADSATANGTVHFDFTAVATDDPAASAEVHAGLFTYNINGGSNGVFTVNGLEGVVRSRFADEAMSARGVHGRIYIDPDSSATLRTGVGGEFSARASYSGGTAIAAENGTAFVGTRIYMAPYFSGGTVGNLNNFWGLWIYGEHTSQRNADAAICIEDAGGGWTYGVDMVDALISTAEIRGQNAETIDNATDGYWDFGDAGLIIDTVAVGIDFTGSYSNAGIDFSNTTLDHTGSNGPVMIRAGTYGSPVSSSDPHQSGMIRLYGSNDAAAEDGTGFYDRGLFAYLRTDEAKGIYPIAGLAEVRTTAGDGPTEVMAGQFIAGLHTGGAKLNAGGWGMFGSWHKVYIENGATAETGTKVAALWVDNDVDIEIDAEHYTIYALGSGLAPDAFIGFQTEESVSQGWTQLLYFDETAYDQPPISNTSLKVLLNATQYYIPLSTADDSYTSAYGIDVGGITTDSAATVTLLTNLVTIGALTTGDQDITLRFSESDDTHDITLDDGNTAFVTDIDFMSDADIGCSSSGSQRIWLDYVGSAAFSALSTAAFGYGILIDPNTAGADTLQLCMTGDADILHSEASENIFDQAGDGIVVGAWTRYLMIEAGNATLGPTAPAWVTYATAGALAFDADGEVVHLTKEIPDDWDGASDLTLKIYWTNEEGDAIANTETVIWLSSYRSLVWGTEDVENGTAVSPSVTYTQSGAGADGDTHESAITIDYDHGDQPITAGDVIVMIFSRDMTNDTYAGDALVIQWEIEYTSVGLSNHN